MGRESEYGDKVLREYQLEELQRFWNLFNREIAMKKFMKQTKLDKK